MDQESDELIWIKDSCNIEVRTTQIHRQLWLFKQLYK
ncbi:spore coat protein [Priestia megaterium]|nr:spore coat protein [Priestia megaterium]